MFAAKLSKLRNNHIISMLQNKLLKKIYFKYLFSIIWTLVILYLSLGRISTDKLPSFDIPHKDKFVHFTMYFIYTFLLLWESKNSHKLKTLLIVIPYTISFGILMEVMQSLFFTYRSGDVYDAIFNTLGVVTMVLIFPKLKKFL